ncbi:short-chain dehydrogenase/reductase SDR [Fulvivirga imtechensis AK7]|uniref:Short-chain dehydrogenase/reductase SDR n=1 Tax=Fulvivirga imtechensis AK7 TaxID=1237149 RepID=L8JWB4_9BACT|nr:SDR family NAD(P)-dependent oxidoreductase [Fulvivirga imtechensis]ELR73321.1 short-chain dehydrogenase/reductase SDR [Fulvivirga imtechensis AK7]
MEYTLVTGASRGIGLALAMECARRKMNVILISLEGEGLSCVAKKLKSKYDVSIHYKELDLAQKRNINHLFDWCVAKEFSINMLVNNAGYSTQKAFQDCDLEEHTRCLKVNVEVLVLMCAKFLPLLKRHNRSYILNLGSIASFMHIPYKALYSASKNFVMALSNALNHEVGKEGVVVSCLCPGPTITNSKVALRTKAQGFKAKVLTLTAEEVARKGIDGALKGKRVIVPGIFNRLLVFITIAIPRSLSITVAGKMFRKK